MKRRYEQTVGGGWVAVLIPETPADQAEIDAMEMRGEVNDYASFGDRRAEVAIAAGRLSRLQRRILAWLIAEEQRTRGMLSAEYHALVMAMGVDKGNLSTSLKGLERKGFMRLQRTSGGKAEAIDLTPRGRTQAEVVNKDQLTQRELGKAAKLSQAYIKDLLRYYRFNRLNAMAFKIPEGRFRSYWLLRYYRFNKFTTAVVNIPEFRFRPY
jgi:DNA-binding MarR family transcriptional regulator